MSNKKWFITGGSSGLGLAMVRKVLKEGNQVFVGTLPPFTALEELQQQYPDKLRFERMDVTDRELVFDTVAEAKEWLGGIDYLYSAAGYYFTGSFDYTTDRQLRNQMEVNFFGSVNVTQAVLRIMEQQRSGVIIQMSSDGGIMTNPFGSAYNASKWAVEGMWECMSKEVGQLGINIVIVEAGPIATGLVSNKKTMNTTKGPLAEAYKNMLAFVNAANGVGESPEDAVNVIYRAATDKNPPLRLLLGTGQLDEIAEQFKQRLEIWEKWRWENRPDPIPMSEEAMRIAAQLAELHAQK